MTREETINIKTQDGEKLTLTEALSVLKRYHFDWRCSQALDVVLEAIDPWHYPSKGEYPKEGETVLLLTNEGDPHLGHFANDYYWETDSFVRTSACIKCWQYIIPPKEEENV